MGKNTKTYECPACKGRITVHVNLAHPPTCSKHAGAGRTMKPINQENNNNE